MEAEVARLRKALELKEADRLKQDSESHKRPQTGGKSATNDKKDKNLENKLESLMAELKAQAAEIADLKKLLEARDKTIEDLKKTLTIHVDKQVVKNTTRTESHVEFLESRKLR